MSRKHLQSDECHSPLKMCPSQALPSCLPVSICQGAGITKNYSVQTRLLLTDNWSLCFLIYIQWGIERPWGSLTLSTNGFSSGNVGGVYICHRPNVVTQCWCVWVATEVKCVHSFDNKIYIWETWKRLTLWDWGFKIHGKHLTCQFYVLFYLVPFQFHSQPHQSLTLHDVSYLMKGCWNEYFLINE